MTMAVVAFASLVILVLASAFAATVGKYKKSVAALIFLIAVGLYAWFLGTLETVEGQAPAEIALRTAFMDGAMAQFRASHRVILLLLGPLIGTLVLALAPSGSRGNVHKNDAA